MKIKAQDNVVRAVAWVAFAISVGLCRQSPAANRDAGTTQPVNPHWRESLCLTCHPKQENGTPNGARLLDSSPRDNCNRCHTANRLSRAMHHPYDVQAPATIRIPREWFLDKNNMTCLTCHDPLRQCLRKLKERWRNPSFLRRSEGETMIGFCLRCHPKEPYQTQSPHDQVDDKGHVRDPVCLYCHKSRPEINKQGEPGRSELKAKMADLCGNCHGDFPHPLGIPHLVGIGEDMLTRMAASEIQDQYVIPLGELERYMAGSKRLPRYLPVNPKTHEATCNTCHNSHEAGVLPATSPLARGAESDSVRNYRLRMPREDLCLCCHRI